MIKGKSISLSTISKYFKFLSASNQATASQELHNATEDGQLHKGTGEDQKPVENPIETMPKYSNVYHRKRRLILMEIFNRMSEEDIDLVQNVTTSCGDLGRIREAIKVRKKYKLCLSLPSDNSDPGYYFENGFRKVYPYSYLFQAFAKRRWVGMKMGEVLKTEFRNLSDEEIDARFETNRTLVNGEPVKFDYLVKPNDSIVNFAHRHELPVLASRINIVHEDAKTVVIDKPPSIPVHPCGRFRLNSVTGILQREHSYKDLKVVHRLDRLTSGLLILAKSSNRANLLKNMNNRGEVRKEYICRVDGEFPVGHIADDGYVIVDKPLTLIGTKVKIMVVDSKGKPSKTRFKRLNYNGKTSAVLCQPLTGRMHQIRVHLQYLGYPILNDSTYNSNLFGPDRGKGGNYCKSFDQLALDVIAQHGFRYNIENDTDLIGMSSDSSLMIDSSQNNTNEYDGEFKEQRRDEALAALENYTTSETCSQPEYTFDSKRWIPDPLCRECKTTRHDPPLEDQYFYLHALRYSSADWSYETPLPKWSQDDWVY